MVFVLNANNEPLTPCHPAVARKLLKSSLAAVWRLAPFTIILKRPVMPEKIASREIRLKIDYGSRHTGLSILQNDTVIWLGVLEHRINIKKNLDDRRAHRRFRRNKLRYRQPRFLNRKKPQGWLPPSLRSRVSNIDVWVRKLRSVCPISTISYENCKFDTQLMRNPEISGVTYQQGELQGYEVREYLLEKYGRKCCYCGQKDVPLEIEHIIPKSRGGTDRVDNLAIACHDCNQRKSSQTAKEFGYPDIHKQAKETLKDASAVNSTRWAVYDCLARTGLPVECGSGALTKMNRITLGLPKEHYYDACCIGSSTPQRLHLAAFDVQYVIAKGKGKHSRTNLDAYGFPRGHFTQHKNFFGFQTGDMVKAVVPKGKNKGIWYGRVLCRKIGFFDLKTRDKRVQGINHKYCRLTQANDGYQYFIERAALSSPSLKAGDSSALSCKTVIDA
jgi:5-methylcytosine-specific restriction endonuclease McrA